MVAAEADALPEVSVRCTQESSDTEAVQSRLDVKETVYVPPSAGTAMSDFSNTIAGSSSFPPPEADSEPWSGASFPQEENSAAMQSRVAKRLVTGLIISMKTD